MPPITWLGLGYSVPVNPSKNRVYVWRKLREFGAGYFKQGVAILPKSPQNHARFTTLSAKIHAMGGDATLIELRFTDPRDEAATIARFQQQSETEYQELLRDCAAVLTAMRDRVLPPEERSDRVRKIIKRYGKARDRDFFHSRAREEVADGLEELVRDMAHVTDELRRQLLSLL